MPKKRPRNAPRKVIPLETGRHKRLTHFNAKGEAHMVNVGAKPITERRAVAEGRILMLATTLDVLGVARIAGIQAAKRTSELIPLCHPLALSAVDLQFTPQPKPPGVHCEATVRTSAKTGVEMEALTAVEIALLTIYDMCKAVDRGMTLTDIRLVEKSGGASGHWTRK